MKIEIEFDVQPATTSTTLPQAEILKGATGYLLALQVGDRFYTASLIPVFMDVIKAGVTYPVLPQADDNEAK